jgi:hypothetical protein
MSSWLFQKQICRHRFLLILMYTKINLNEGFEVELIWSSSFGIVVVVVIIIIIVIIIIVIIIIIIIIIVIIIILYFRGKLVMKCRFCL